MSATNSNPPAASATTVTSGAEASNPDGAAVLSEPRPPSYWLMGGIAGVGFVLDLTSKAWAEKALGDPNGKSQIVLIDDVLGFILAYNKGGAFSMGASVSDSLRAPFFLVVGLVAIGFIVSLYRKVTPEQWTLRYGLPLVLAGALGNLYDRVTKGKVVDFIDYQASWVELMNSLIAKVQSSWHVTDHWPTFNVADICITVGVGLMALDMFLSGRAQPKESSAAPSAQA
jgi:signal peptidase II